MNKLVTIFVCAVVIALAAVILSTDTVDAVNWNSRGDDLFAVNWNS